MKKYLYDNYIIDLSLKIQNRLSEISADYNFDYGDEFEIAICELLRSFLPTKYGICRGFVVNKQGEKAGDDIIVYDQDRFPTLKQLSKEDWSRKENIPIEAVYCYIEAKYTLNIGIKSEDSNLTKAIEQVKNVKKLVQERTSFGLTKNDPYHTEKKETNIPHGIYPSRNPIFTMILSRFVSNGKDKLKNNLLTTKLINEFIKKTNVDDTYPESIVAGESHTICTSIDNRPNNFIIPNVQNRYILIEKKNIALAISFIHMYSAIDWIRLDAMPWHEIFNDAKN